MENEILQLDNVIIRVINLPICVKGVTVPHPDGTYNIFINSQYSIDVQRDTLKHELNHIKNLDFDNFDNIQLIEQRASAI